MSFICNSPQIYDFVIVRNGQRLITGSADSELRVWDIEYIDSLVSLHCRFKGVIIMWFGILSFILLHILHILLHILLFWYHMQFTVDSIKISKFIKMSVQEQLNCIECITIIQKLEEDAEPVLKRMKMEGEEEGEDEEEDGEDLVSECYSVEKGNIHVYIDLCPEVTEVCLQKDVEDFEVNISKREMIFF